MQQDSGKLNRLLPLLLVFLVFSWLGVSGQEERILVEQDSITDISGTPIYPGITYEKDGERTWKPEYAYLDSIEMYRITYLSDGLRVTGYMVKPRGSGQYPCIIFNRGGNRDFGQLLVAHAATLLGRMASKGYVVIASNYRGNGGGEGVEEFGGADVNDVLRLVDVLGEVEAADTSRIGMMGWSRGGMMTYLALCRTNRLKAAVVGGAIADLTTGDRPEMEEHVYAELIPGYDTNKEEVLKERSALFWPKKFPKTTPILILHGNADWRVKSDQSLQMARALDKERIPYRLVVYEGADHGISEFRDEVFEESLAWFNRYLRDGEPLPNMEFHGK